MTFWYIPNPLISTKMPILNTNQKKPQGLQKTDIRKAI